jgi:prepilin-type N-terminal cleavage/methylation domain-containing protein
MADRAHTTGSVRHGRGAGEGGFTLIEILAAILVLSIGVTSLLAVMGTGLTTHRESDLRVQASDAVRLVEADLVARLFAGEQTGADPRDLEDVPLAGRAGMRYSVKFRKNPTLPDEFLAEIDITWLEAGETRGESFARLIHREEPFSRRIQKLKP